MSDILYQTKDSIFSYRVAGICIQNGRVLLQKPTNDDGYAFPGGHAALGETNEETLIREFREETGAEISVGELKWVGEIFFSWGKKPCHQICLYYLVEITSPHTPRSGSFLGREQFSGQAFDMEFHWVPLDEIPNLLVYPQNAPALLCKLDRGVQHFVCRETESKE